MVLWVLVKTAFLWRTDQVDISRANAVSANQSPTWPCRNLSTFDWLISRANAESANQRLIWLCCNFSTSDWSIFQEPTLYRPIRAWHGPAATSRSSLSGSLVSIFDVNFSMQIVYFRRSVLLANPMRLSFELKFTTTTMHLPLFSTIFLHISNNPRYSQVSHGLSSVCLPLPIGVGKKVKW